MSRIFTPLVALILTLSAGAPAETTIRYCPPIQSLVKDTQSLQWSTASGWTSYSPSFAHHIKQLMGAQWQGINVGTLFCVYQGDGQNFNIVLQAPGLVNSPLHIALPKDHPKSLWHTNPKGFLECFSHQRTHCPFIAHNQVTDQDPYRSILELKKPPTETPSF